MGAKEFDKGDQLRERLSQMDRYREATRGLIVDNIGRRGASLLFFAFLNVVYAGSLFFAAPPAQRTASVNFLSEIAPLSMWGTVWLVCGLVCMFYAFREDDKFAFAIDIALKTLWGLLHFVGWLFVHVDRAYVSATIWMFAAGLLAVISSWPEPVHVPRYPDTPRE